MTKNEYTSEGYSQVQAHEEESEALTTDGKKKKRKLAPVQMTVPGPFQFHFFKYCLMLVSVSPVFIVYGGLWGASAVHMYPCSLY